MVSRTLRKHWNGSCSKKNGPKMSLWENWESAVLPVGIVANNNKYLLRECVSLECIKHSRGLK